MSPATPTPSTLPHSISAPTTRLRKRNSMGRPLSSYNRLENGKGTAPAASIPDTRVRQDPGGRRQEALTENPRPLSNHANSVFEFRGDGTAKASWLRRMSTLSSLRNGSSISTPMPESSSVSYSNGSTAHGSTAPILPDFAEINPAVTHRNKLVKRSSSQRALGNTTTTYTTLRRPATSHQRSATLQQQYQQDERSVIHPTPRSSMFFDGVQEEQDSSDESIRSWQYLFRPKNVWLAKDGSSRVRSAAGSTPRNETLKTIMPDVTELPTLLLATSITPRSAGSDRDMDQSARHAGHRPSTPPRFQDSIEQPWTGTHSQFQRPQTSNEQDVRRRRSFSLADMFPSPSPSTWKIPRSGSLRRAKGPAGASGGRRVVSAPQSSKPVRSRGTSQAQSSHAARGRSKPIALNDNHPPPLRANPVNPYTGATASSPLPPLNRLSSFDIDLPGAAPSYPTTPQSDLAALSPRLSSPPSPLMSSPLAPSSNRNPSQHPSLAVSDKGSTLLGSDNDNSRMLSGDEDDADLRSDTVYDSTRTGATGSSHSNLRRPPIESIFDEPLGDYQKNKATALQDLLSHETFSTVDVLNTRINEEEEHVATPIANAVVTEKAGSIAPVYRGTIAEPIQSQSPITQVLNPHSPDEAVRDMDEPTIDEVWAIESLEDSEKGSAPGGDSTLRSTYTQRLANSHANDLDPLPISDDTGGISHANVFDWSESPPPDKDSSSPRPRTVHGRHGNETRGSRTTARRGPSAMHLRSQSVPVAPESSNHRTNTSKLEAWVLGNKGVSEDWDGDFEFEEKPPTPKIVPAEDGPIRSSISSGMLVPRSIMERQASVHGQFGHVKELTILVEELKLLRQQASSLDVLSGPSAELWKEADGIINLATLDDDEPDFFSPRSPNSPGLDFDPFEEDSPAVSDRRRSTASPSRDHGPDDADRRSGNYTPANSTPDRSRLETPHTSRPRKESAAKAKSVLETIHQQRSHYSPGLLNERTPSKKLPFDTTSLRDLVTRAGVVTRALKEIVRRAEKAADGSSASTRPDSSSDDSTPPPGPPPKPDPPFSQIFQPPGSSPSRSKTPRVTQSPKGSSNNFRGANIARNDNEINGHMKLMTVI
ncbi:MAG: hypothetical protein Q9212_002143 [Teloschistes hypoglaucus]